MPSQTRPMSGTFVGALHAGSPPAATFPFSWRVAADEVSCPHRMRRPSCRGLQDTRSSIVRQIATAQTLNVAHRRGTRNVHSGRMLFAFGVAYQGYPQDEQTCFNPRSTKTVTAFGERLT